MDKNNCIVEFNELIHSTYSKQVGFKFLNVNRNVKNEGTTINETNDNNVGYNYLLFDNVHLNNRFGLLLLKKLDAITFVTYLKRSSTQQRST